MTIHPAARRFWCMFLAFSMALMPSLLLAEQASSPGQSTEPAADSASERTADPRVDLSYVPPSALAAVVAHPQSLLNSPEMEMLPLEVLSAAGRQELGLDPMDIDTLLAVVIPPGTTPPGFGIVLGLSKPYALDELKGPMVDRTEPAELDGTPYRRAMRPDAPSVMMPNDRTLIVATEPAMRSMLANHANPADGPLVRLMRKTKRDGEAMAVVVLEPVRDMINAQMAAAPIPPFLGALRQVPNLIDAAKLDVSLSGMPEIALIILAPDEQSAVRLENLLNAMLNLGHQAAMMQMASEMDEDDPIQQAMAKYTRRISGKAVEMLRPERDKNKLRIALGGEDDQAAIAVATSGILVALLLPAIQSARAAARRTASANNLKQIGVAMHTYYVDHNAFPAAANHDAEGKPLLSWRVHLLPYVADQHLYEQFHLDEPWDSEHNKKLIGRMPEVYDCPAVAVPPGHTIYQLPVGEGTLFPGGEAPQMPHRMGNSVMAVEASPEAAVPWTKPADWEFDPDNPMRGLGGVHPEGWNVLFGDGSVRLIHPQTDASAFGNLVAPSE